ncbi:unnamed protein product [Phytophthora fragariaefolia]|uniref:Unnamed protein product n=1 Tax=Phytophthora fragariaefolia TaxID=1490495 RepID=A0A9W6TSI1_9STRA|nr:unnamed protein product [Phytophthora fragariaefolia]
MIKTLKQHQDDEYAAGQLYKVPGLDEVASMVEFGAMNQDRPHLEIEIQIGSVHLMALLETGYTNSVTDQKIVKALRGEVMTERDTAHARKTDNLVGQTTHRAAASFKLLTFSNNRSCTHPFRVVEALLYPVMLGKDFVHGD